MIWDKIKSMIYWSSDILPHFDIENIHVVGGNGRIPGLKRSKLSLVMIFERSFFKLPSFWWEVMCWGEYVVKSASVDSCLQIELLLSGWCNYTQFNQSKGNSPPDQYLFLNTSRKSDSIQSKWYVFQRNSVMVCSFWLHSVCFRKFEIHMYSIWLLQGI